MPVTIHYGMRPPQVDNKGNHLLVHEESSINVPAIAAAHVIKRYIAQASDELSFEVTHSGLTFHCLTNVVTITGLSDLTSSLGSPRRWATLCL